MLIMALGFGLLGTMDMETTKWTATFYMIVLGLGVGLVMPILTLALQESFPKSELGVVTSSSQFFRSIGGTFGMTILGAVMNHRSSNLLEDRLMPMLQSLPAQAKGMVDQFKHMIHDDPQGLYSMLLSPKALEKMPPQFSHTLVPILKHSLVDSLHSVFLFSLVFVVLGAVLTLALHKIKLTAQRRAEKEAS
jgi:MFS family permease